jgi:hypothetical protein
MAASTKPAPVQDDVDEMFGKPAIGTSEDDFAGVDDLLDTVEEDDSEGWVPKEKGEGIAGIVVKVGETKSDFAAEGTDATVPVVTIETKDGNKWRVIGYGAVLKREITDADPKRQVLRREAAQVGQVPGPPVQALRCGGPAQGRLTRSDPGPLGCASCRAALPVPPPERTFDR